MNAQEAIERTEKLIEQHKNMQMFFADKRDPKQVRRYESLEKEIEALSIVLESAKHLHMYIAVVEKRGAFIETFTHEGFKLVPFMTMTAEVAKRIGIEEGADE